ESLKESSPSVILLDLNLPDSQGAETFRKVLQKAPNVPVVILSGQDDEALLRSLEMSRKQQLEFKNQFLSHVSHELRTPLTCIHQFVSILYDGLAGEVSP